MTDEGGQHIAAVKVMIYQIRAHIESLIALTNTIEERLARLGQIELPLKRPGQESEGLPRGRERIV